MKNNCKCPKKCDERVYIERIVHGQMGLRGETGPTGPTGPAVETIEVRSTKTVEPSDNAEVMLTKEGNTNYLDFYIPRGFDGVAEVISVGSVETIDPDLPAEVVDRFNEQVHYFDFRIPRGVTGSAGEKGEKGATGDKGERGEKGVKGDKGDKGDTGERGLPGEIGISPIIVVDEVQTAQPDEEAEVFEDIDGVVHHWTLRIPRGVTGAQGEKGEQGERGAQGIAGPSGSTPGYVATIYNPNAQSVNNGMTLTLPETETLAVVKKQDNTLVAPANGIYLISYSINNGTNANAGDYVAVEVNNVLVPASKRPIAQMSNSSATVVTNLNKDDVIKLVATTGQEITISASTAPSAVLTMMLIAY